MKFIIRTHDDLNKIGVRREYMEDHLQYLSENEKEILVAGSLRERMDKNPVGALWIVECDSKKRATELVESDPFFRNGLREKYELLHWSKAFEHSASV